MATNPTGTGSQTSGGSKPSSRGSSNSRPEGPNTSASRSTSRPGSHPAGSTPPGGTAKTRSVQQLPPGGVSVADASRGGHDTQASGSRTLRRDKRSIGRDPEASHQESRPDEAGKATASGVDASQGESSDTRARITAASNSRSASTKSTGSGESIVPQRDPGIREGKKVARPEPGSEGQSGAQTPRDVESLVKLMKESRSFLGLGLGRWPTAGGPPPSEPSEPSNRPSGSVGSDLSRKDSATSKFSFSNADTKKFESVFGLMKAQLEDEQLLSSLSPLLREYVAHEIEAMQEKARTVFGSLHSTEKTFRHSKDAKKAIDRLHVDTPNDMVRSVWGPLLGFQQELLKLNQLKALRIPAEKTPQIPGAGDGAASGASSTKESTKAVSKEPSKSSAKPWGQEKDDLKEDTEDKLVCAFIGNVVESMDEINDRLGKKRDGLAKEVAQYWHWKLITGIILALIRVIFLAFRTFQVRTVQLPPAELVQDAAGSSIRVLGAAISGTLGMAAVDEDFEL